MNDAQLKELMQKNFTLKGRIFYPTLLQPTQKPTRDGGVREQYATAFAWPKGENQQVLNEINNLLMTVKNAKFPTVPMQFFLNPIKDFETYQRQDGRPNPEFWRDHYWLNAQSGGEFPPQVVDKSLQPIIDASLVYSGANAAVNISFYLIDNEKKGFGVNINAVMLTGGGDPAGGGQSVNVADAFGSFASDMNAGGQQMQGQNNFNQNAMTGQVNTMGNQQMNQGGNAPVGNGGQQMNPGHMGQDQFGQQNMGGQSAQGASPSNGQGYNPNQQQAGQYDPNQQQQGQWNPMNGGQGQNNNNGFM